MQHMEITVCGTHQQILLEGLQASGKKFLKKVNINQRNRGKKKEVSKRKRGELGRQGRNNITRQKTVGYSSSSCAPCED